MTSGDEHPVTGLSANSTREPADAPRVDEIFNRALVAQLAEQRAQRETTASVERKLEGLERLMAERLGDLSRQLGSDGQLEGRLELLEETVGSRMAGLERVVRVEVDHRLGSMAERLAHVEASIGGDETGARLAALESTVRRRLGELEAAVRDDDLADRLDRIERALAEGLPGLHPGENGSSGLGGRLEALEQLVAGRLSAMEESLRDHDVARRMGTLEAAVAERIGHLEETVRSEEIGRRMKSLELAIDERSGRIEEFVKAADLEHRMEDLARAVDERLSEFGASWAPGSGGPRPEPVVVHAPSPLDESVSARLAGLEGSLRRLQEDTVARLDDLRAAGVASEAGILERIIAESHVVGAHFQAVRPVVEAAMAARPEIERAVAEVRALTEAARAAALELTGARIGRGSAEGEGNEAEADPSGPYTMADLEQAQDAPSAEAVDSVLQPPEETPIPDRRFGIKPRRDR